MTRRFTRHSFNRALPFRARRAVAFKAGDYCGIVIVDERDFEAIEAGGCAPPVIATQPARLPPINLRDAPSGMEMRAEGWASK